MINPMTHAQKQSSRTQKQSTPALPPAANGLLSGSKLSIERSPRLQTVFNDISEATQKVLTEFSATKIELCLERFWAGTCDELDISDDEHIVIEFELVNFPASIWVSVDRTGLYIIMEALLGASTSPRPYMADRDFTEMEFAFAKSIAFWFSQSFSECFKPFANMAMRQVSVTTGSKASFVLSDSTSYLTANMAVDVFDQTGHILIFLSQDLLAPMKTLFENTEQSLDLTNDSVWTEHIKSHFQDIDLECKAAIDCRDLTLAEVADFKVGQILDLGIGPDEPVKLKSGGRDLFIAELGQSDGVFTVKITEKANQKQSLFDTVTGNA